MTQGHSSLHVVPAEVRAIGRIAYDIAEELRSGSASLDTEIRGLLGTWTGSAADAFQAGWDEMHSGALAVWQSLVDLAGQLGVNAEAYQDQDDATASSFSSLRLD